MTIYKAVKLRKLVAVLLSHGFVVIEGSNHTKYYCNEHQATIILPRHKNVSPGVVKNTTNLLVKTCGLNEQYLLKVL
ncbi:MAG: type II toxin-antitoxin system HicA family toxin [Candidatus Nomurabacteria bacterium]|jgi:hypothetical protein|nr:type II toxin-antitoxin system HicA family toxin [Candidatus Nomurabacteria bacterium]